MEEVKKNRLNEKWDNSKKKRCLDLGRGRRNFKISGQNKEKMIDMRKRKKNLPTSTVVG